MPTTLISCVPRVIRASEGSTREAFQAGMADETINIYADLNHDGKIDQAEAQHALQWAAGQRMAP